MSTQPGGVKIAGQVTLPASRLAVRLHEDDDLTFLEVRSLVDDQQWLLLPVTQQRVLVGLSLTSRLSRLHGHAWALAYGTGRLADRCVLRFQSDGLRYRRTVDVVPHRLGEQMWVADVEGIFAAVALVTDEVETHRVPLATRW